MIYQRPKAKQRIGRDFLMWGEEVENILGRRKGRQLVHLLMNSTHIDKSTYCVPNTVHKADVSPDFARHRSKHMMYTTESLQ